MPPGTPRQLALALAHRESHAREDFLEGPSNRAALALVDAWPDWPGPAVVLVGPEGSGKSHLASIWSRMAGARFISGRALREGDVPSALATGALVLEDLTDGRFDEKALFHLLNLAREEAACVLVTARSRPVTWAVRTADLASRLRALPTVEIGPPDDALLRAVLVKQLADRQLQADEELVSYLVARIERSFESARATIDLLDREALRQRRPLTRALAAALLSRKP